MPRLIERPAVIEAAGNKPKTIEEYAGRVNSGHSNASVSRMISPEGWVEPGERVRYSSPEPGGAEYVSVCIPAFGPDAVHRDPADG